MQNEWHFQTSIFYVVNTAALELHYARKILCSQIHYNFVRCKIAEIWRGVYSNVNIGDWLLFFELLLWNIDIQEFLFQVEYFPSKFKQSVSADRFPEKSVQ